MTNEEIIEQLENTIGLIKQDGKDWLDDRDIPILEECIKSISALDKIRAEIEQLPTNTRINWDGCCPDIDYPEIEYIDVTKNGLLSIIDKYKTETEVRDGQNTIKD